jgi:hypothetical protein
VLFESWKVYRFFRLRLPVGATAQHPISQLGIALRWAFALIQPYPTQDLRTLSRQERTRGPSYATTESELLTKVIPEAQAMPPVEPPRPPRQPRA